MYRKLVLIALVFASAQAIAQVSSSAATTLTVGVAGDSGFADVGTLTGTTGDLRGVLNYINLFPGTYNVVFALSSGNETITLQKPLPIVNMNAVNAITINGSNTSGSGTQITLSGNSLYRGFLVRQATTANPVTIQNLTFSKCTAIGGAGGAPAGGGGMGAGGGIFVDNGVTGSSSMILSNVSFSGCGVMGGNGTAGTSTANVAGGGGGGMGGAGGNGGTNAANATNGGGGGGGLFGAGGNGGASAGTGAGGGGGGGGALGLGGSGGGSSAATTGGSGGGGGSTVSAIGGNGAASGAATAGSSSGLIPNATAGNYVAGGGGGSSGSAGTASAAGGGNGGVGNAAASSGGGGGGSLGSPGTSGTIAVAGVGGSGGGGGGGVTFVGGTGGNGAGGGGSTTGVAGGSGGYGGGSGGTTAVTNAATAGFGGGGGGTGGAFTGGTGGFGGGGAGSANVAGAVGGTGGFGGAGGGKNSAGTSIGVGGQGGGFGGISSPSGGGSGAALGGAIFIAGSGALEIRGAVTTTNSASTAGTVADTSAGTGVAAATDIFVQTGTSLVFNPINTTDTNSFSGTIGDDAPSTLSGSNVTSGTGTGAALVKNGLGTTILSGVNTWGRNGGTGTFTINAGTVQVNNANSFGNFANTVIFAGNGTERITGTYTSTRPRIINSGVTATLSIAAGNTWTSSGSISGQGTLLKRGAGTMVLTNTNFYQGGTQINNGVLQINAVSNLGSGGVTFTDEGTLQFAAAGSYTFPSLVTNSGVTGTLDPQTFAVTLPTAITGAGGITLVSTGGGGTLTITSSSYSGTTLITAGTLIAGQANALAPNSQFNLTGGTVSFGSANQTIGSLTGTGGVISMGSGSLTMGGDNTSPSAFAGIISGTGGVTKVGGGTLGLSGANAYTGTTTINGGRLNIIGSIVSPVVVNTGATLGGSGSIVGSVTVNAGGTLTPGTSIGTLSITGPLSISSNSTTNIEINPSGSSVIAVGGTASIGGALNVIVDAGSYSSAVYPFLTATSLSGAFRSITFTGTTPPGFVGFLTYSQNGVTLNVTVPPAFAASSFSGSSRNVGNALNAQVSNPAYASLLSQIFSLPTNEQNAALNSIGAARNSMDAFVTMNEMYSFMTMIGNRMSLLRSFYAMGMSGSSKTVALANPLSQEDLVAQNNNTQKQRMPMGSAKRAAVKPEQNCIWLEALGDWASQSGQNQMPDLNFNTRGLFLGYDFFGFKDGMVGVAAGYARSNLLFENAQGSADINSWTIGPYGTVYVEDGFIELGAFFTVNQNNNIRHIFFPGYETRAHSNHMSYQLAPHIAGGYDWMQDFWILEPFASLDLVLDWESEYTETGAGILNLTMRDKMIEMLRTEIGVRGYQVLDRSWGACVFREVLGYVNKTPWGASGLKGTFVGTTTPFSVEGFTQSQNLFTIGAEALFKGNNGMFGSFAYDGEFFSGYVSNQAQVTVGAYF